jgi:hypothetical protein
VKKDGKGTEGGEEEKERRTDVNLCVFLGVDSLLVDKRAVSAVQIVEPDSAVLVELQDGVLARDRDVVQQNIAIWLTSCKERLKQRNKRTSEESGQRTKNKEGFLLFGEIYSL